VLCGVRCVGVWVTRHKTQRACMSSQAGAGAVARRPGFCANLMPRRGVCPTFVHTTFSGPGARGEAYVSCTVGFGVSSSSLGEVKVVLVLLGAGLKAAWPVLLVLLVRPTFKK
jgi:hypothetical protein